MKLNPILALPLVTLMMLLSATFLRLPGTVVVESGGIVYPRDLREVRAGERQDSVGSSNNFKIDNSTLPPSSEQGLSARDIRRTALGLDLPRSWDSGIRYTNTSNPGTSRIVKDFMLAQGHSKTFTVNPRQLRARHIARR